jgi:hypothetical protein
MNGTFWYKWTKELAEKISEKFKTGKSTYKANPPHGQSGLALSYSSVDLSLGGSATTDPKVKAHGDEVLNYLITNWDVLKIRFICWDWYSYKDGGKVKRKMSGEGRGDAAHVRHLHVTFELR